MKKIALLLLSTILAFSVFAQTEKGYVYLKNGSIVKGKYSFTDNRESIRVESAGNVWIFNTNEIDSISSKRIKTATAIDEAVADKSIFFRSELGVLAGNSENSQTAPFSLSGSVNYRMNPNFSTGVGFGVEFFNETYMPVFANFEYKFKAVASTPYLFLKVGYQVPLEETNAMYYDRQPAWSSIAPWPTPGNENQFEAQGGSLINPGVGVTQMFSQGFGMSFAVGYQFHRLSYKGENSYKLDVDYNRLSIKIGIIFN